MLTFEEKLTIIETFPQLVRKEVSLNRVNFHFPESQFEKKSSSITCIQTGTGLFTQQVYPDMKKTGKDSSTSVNFRSRL